MSHKGSNQIEAWYGNITEHKLVHHWYFFSNGPPLRIAKTVLPPNRPDNEESSEQVTENTYKSLLQPYLSA
jgi:hypothetical protein